MDTDKTRKTKSRIDARRTRGTCRTGILDRMNRMGRMDCEDGIRSLRRVDFTQSRKDAKAQRCSRGKNGSESGLAIRFHPLSFAFGPTSIRLRPGQIIRLRSHTFAFVRLRSLTIFLFMNDIESEKGRKFLPGWWRAPECVTANSPEYAALAGLKHRDSPQYVTKKNMSDRMNRMGSGLTIKEDMRSAGRRPLHAGRVRSPGLGRVRTGTACAGAIRRGGGEQRTAFFEIGLVAG